VVELVLKLGLLCSNPMAVARPNMRQVVQFLEGDAYMSFTRHPSKVKGAIAVRDYEV